MATITEPSRTLPVFDEVDLCVLGGSCTGVFAAVRAARLGARVAVIEKQNCFGGSATGGNVHIWHSLEDTTYSQRIIGGLTQEVLDRLRVRDAVRYTPCELNAFELNTEELKIELDILVREHGILPWLHSVYAAPYLRDGRLAGVFIETKSGRGAILARQFLDATGEGDLCWHLGLSCYVHDSIQPPTLIAKFYGTDSLGDWDWRQAVADHGHEFDYREDWGWNAPLPGIPELAVWSETHVFGANCADARQLTAAEMEGRRQIRAQMDIMRCYGPPGSRVALADLAGHIGIQDARHIRCRHQLTEAEVLAGTGFDDAIANGTYRVDIHHNDRLGLTFRYLDGVQEDHYSRREPPVVTRWRPETAENPTFYQIPFRCLVPERPYDNLLLAGRMLDADAGAFGAARVMVNMNQTGEAAGVAAVLALDAGCPVSDVDTQLLRTKLLAGGSIII